MTSCGFLVFTLFYFNVFRYTFEFDSDPYGNDGAQNAISCKVQFYPGNLSVNVEAISKPPTGQMVPQHQVIKFEKYNLKDESLWTNFIPPSIPVSGLTLVLFNDFL